MKAGFAFLLLMMACLIVQAQHKTAAVKHNAVNLILDTDIGPDYDDVGAMAVMHALADSGEVKILATIACNQSPYTAPVLNVLNTYFKKPDIPIGVVRSRAVAMPAWQKWDSVLASRYPHNIKTNKEGQDALSLYRKTLAAQPDGSVTIVTIGFLTNLADLLQSGPDAYAALDGKELIQKKVAKLVCMAGAFPKGKEFNVDRDPVSSKIVFDGWPTPIIFSGWEIGNAVHTGLPLINSNAIKSSPVKDAFAIAIPMAAEDAGGRMSWDQTAVLVAIKGHENFYDAVEGKFVCNSDGSNVWDARGKGHFYLKEKLPVPQMEKLLNNLMMHQPVMR